MKHMYQFETRAEYETALAAGEIETPSVSYIKDEAVCAYRILQKSNFGDICMWNRIDKNYKFITPSSYCEGYWRDLGLFPVGVVAVPTKYTPDNSTRLVSLVNMSCVTPESGTTTTARLDNYMYWGGNVNVADLKDMSSCVKIDSASGEFMSLERWTSMPSDMKYSDAGFVDPSGNYYFDAYEEAGAMGPYFCLSDGEKNPLYYYEGTTHNDFDGSSNTDKIVKMAEGGSYASWKTDTSIINNNEDYNFPAAFCCRRFRTDYGSKAGDWYLPAQGELMFLAMKFSAINTGLEAVASKRGTAYAVAVKNYEWLWSSTEQNTQSAYRLMMNSGGCSYRYKQYVDSLNRTRAFLTVK